MNLEYIELNGTLWPVPPKTSGVGIHFGNVTEKALYRQWGDLTRLEHLKALHMKWVVLAADSDGNIGKVATILLQNGIMPIARPQRYINRPTNWAALARTCKSPYVQIYNEPSDTREWWYRKPRGWRDFFKHKWISAAHAVRSVGCYPGLQLTSPNDLWDMLWTMEGLGETDLWDSMWLSLHLYPTDDCLPWCIDREYGIFAWQEYARIAKEITGLDMPMIVTEGGWTDGQGTPGDRADWMVSVYEWFKYGEVPDNLLAVCPYIFFGRFWFGFSWLENINHQPMVEAVKAMGEWERGKPGPTPPEPEPEKENWYLVCGPMFKTEAEAWQRHLEETEALDFRLEERE